MIHTVLTDLDDLPQPGCLGRAKTAGGVLDLKFLATVPFDAN